MKLSKLRAILTAYSIGETKGRAESSNEQLLLANQHWEQKLKELQKELDRANAYKETYNALIVEFLVAAKPIIRDKKAFWGMELEKEVGKLGAAFGAYNKDHDERV